MSETSTTGPSLEKQARWNRQSAVDFALRLGTLTTVTDLLASAAAIAAFISGDDAPAAEPAKPARGRPAKDKVEDAPKTEEAKTTPAAGFDADGKEITLLDFKTAAGAWLDYGGTQEKLREWMGVDKVSELAPAKYAEVLAKFSAPARSSVLDD